jgi:hypothetical protein
MSPHLRCNQLWSLRRQDLAIAWRGLSKTMRKCPATAGGWWPALSCTQSGPVVLVSALSSVAGVHLVVLLCLHHAHMDPWEGGSISCWRDGQSLGSVVLRYHHLSCSFLFHTLTHMHVLIGPYFLNAGRNLGYGLSCFRENK